MGWGSTVPVAISALVTAFRGAPGLGGVAVYDGPDLSGSSTTAALTVGASPDPSIDTTAAAEGQSSHEGLSTARNHEQYTIHCGLSVLNGGSDAPAARGRLFELFAEVGAYLAANPGIGQNSMQAQLGTWTFAQEQTQMGAVASIAFGVDIDAYTLR